MYDWIDYLGLRSVVSDYAGNSNNTPMTLAASPARTIKAELRTRRIQPTAPRLIMSREATPFGRGALEARLLRRADHSVFDFDDAIFLPPGIARRATGGSNKARRSVSAADVVVAGNELLAEWAARYAADVRIIPSCVEPADYQVKASWDVGDRPVLVWLGSPATEMYIANIAEQLLEVHHRTGATLTVISGGRENPQLASLTPMLRRVAWNADTFAQHLQAADIAIAPLSDTPYARGKCAYKLVQYAATGLPMIGSPVGANLSALDRFSGVAVTHEAEWVDGLLQLINEASDKRRARGESAATSVEKHYSFASWRKDWCEAMDLPATAASTRAGGRL
jgi:glycosyltransferase involved in cell wall biosynthesis